MRTYEKHLPEGYAETAHICGVESGFWNDLKTVLPGILLVITGCFCVEMKAGQVAASLALFAACIYPYFVLHELVHAVVYAVFTRQKVRIGFTKGGAYCSMPELYVYRTVAVICTAAPLVVFAVLMTVGCAAAIAGKHWLFLPVGLLLAFHLLGCRSDVHLLKQIGKHKDSRTLVRDNGAEQWIYQK